ncbi:MAG: hypothetical protein FIA97_19305, partial [Methylococcaceae bacterium]|nr:hypothetical protein [Methylococcaceae bacterium]
MRNIRTLWIVLLIFGAAIAAPAIADAVDAPIGVKMGKRVSVVVTKPVLNRNTGFYEAKLSITNKTKNPLFGPFSVVLISASRPSVEFTQPDGDSTQGPYILVHPTEDRLEARKRLRKIVLRFNNSSHKRFKPRLTVYGLLAPNHVPEANAGSDQHVKLGQTVHLDGSASTDADGQTLNGSWTLLVSPAGSQAALSADRAIATEFTPDLPGTYQAQLIVNDRITDSAPALVTITVGERTLSGPFSVDAPILPEPPLAAPNDQLIPPPALAAVPLLNEVRHQSDAGQSAYVELKGVLPPGITGGLILRNTQGQTYAIPHHLAPKDQNGIVTVYFDGLNQVTGDLAHAAPADFLAGDSGTLILEDTAGTLLDLIQWGAGDPHAVSGRNTGVVDSDDHATLSREPWSVATATAADWYLARPHEVTPGRPNRYSGVGALFPGDNDVVQAAGATLSWYPVSGALNFKVQVAKDMDFTQVVLEQTVVDGPVTLNIEPGGYYWRVQAGYENGLHSDPSAIRRLVLVATDPVGDISGSSAAIPGTATSVPGTPSLASAGDAPVMKVIVGVPLYSQHKDTTMLTLESDQKTGTAHAWNAAHPGLDRHDPADIANCARASISMIHGYFAGASSDKPKLSQDRIGLEIFTKSKHFVGTLYPGPEFDTGFGIGFNLADDGDHTDGLAYALGATPSPRGITPDELKQLTTLNIPSLRLRETFWADLRDSVDQGKPLLLSYATESFAASKHTVVVVGWAVDARGVRFVYVNDPWMEDETRKSTKLKWLGGLPLLKYWTIPSVGTLASQEADFSQPPQKGGANPDSDQDDISDYDEVRRFHTNPNKVDTDSDCIDDFHEIEGSVFNPQHGWGMKWAPIKRVPPEIASSDGAARDNKAPELDGVSPDRDGGGLPDTLEDFNLNGNFEKDLGETDPDNPSDDLTRLTGYMRTFRDQLETDLGYSSHIEQDMLIELDLHLNGGGKISGLATVTHTQTITHDRTTGPP